MLILVHFGHIQELLIVSRVTCKLAEFQMIHDINDLIHKFGIMGNEHKSIRILLQVVRQPVDMLNIQIVGRLIEQQYIRFLQKQLRQQHLSPLSPAQ